MSKPHVIGFTGPARSGKDTATALMLSLTGGYQYSMAGPLKRMMQAGFGIDMSDPYWIEHKEDVIPALGKSPRQMMQTLGTEWGRELVNQNVWIILATDHLLSNGPGMIISDVRFANEAAFVRQYGRLIHIGRDQAQAVNAHVSEAGIPFEGEAGDLRINNSGTLEELRDTIRDYADGWGR